MSVTTLPLSRTLEAEHQRDQREFWLMAVHGLPPARAKKVLLEAHGFGYLSAQDCTSFLDACGLGAA